MVNGLESEAFIPSDGAKAHVAEGIPCLPALTPGICYEREDSWLSECRPSSVHILSLQAFASHALCKRLRLQHAGCVESKAEDLILNLILDAYAPPAPLIAGKTGASLAKEVSDMDAAVMWEPLSQQQLLDACHFTNVNY